MTPSFETTYGVFAQNKTNPWVDSKNKLILDSHIKGLDGSGRDFCEKRIHSALRQVGI